MIENILEQLKSKPHNPHYLARYTKFIKYHVNQIFGDIAYESHHILPKSIDMFPEFAKNKLNLINLTPRQHFIAHWMLWKIYTNSSMSYAFKRFVDGAKGRTSRDENYKITSKTYEQLKKDHALYNSKNKLGKVNARNLLTGETFSMSSEEFWNSADHIVGASRSNKGKKFPKEWRDNMRKSKSDEHKMKIGDANRGVSLVDKVGEVRAKEIIDILKKPKSEEHKRNIRESKKNTPKFLCEYCGLSVIKANYVRWHGNKCKLFTEIIPNTV